MLEFITAALIAVFIVLDTIPKVKMLIALLKGKTHD